MRLIAALIAMLAILAGGAAFAQEDEALLAIEARRERLATIEETLDATNLSQRALLSLRDEARSIRREAEIAAEPLRLRVAELQADLDQLGPRPEASGPGEDATISEARADLERQLARADGARRQAELNVAAAARIGRTVSERRRDAFTAELLVRGPSPLGPNQIRDAAAAFAEGVQRAEAGAGAWLAEKRAAGEQQDAVLAITTALILAVMMLVPIRRRVNLAISSRIATVEPLPSRRVLVAAARTAGKILPGLLGGFFVYEALRLTDVVTDITEPLAQAVWIGFVIILFADGAVTSVFAPRQPNWRVTPLGNRSALVVRVLVLTAAIIAVADLVLQRGADLLVASPVLSFVQEGLIAIALSILVFGLCWPRLWVRPNDIVGDAQGPTKLAQADAPPGAPETPTVAVTPAEPTPAPRSAGWHNLRQIGRLIAAAALVLTVLGFAHLGYFLTTRTLALLALFSVIWSLRALMREGVRLVDKRFSRKAQEEAESGDRLFYSWLGFGIDLLALVAFVPPALVVLGAQPSDVQGWLGDAFFGFEVGSVRISVAKMLSGLLVFFGLLWVTRSAQRTMETKVFPRSRLDAGVKNSLKTLVGYVGLIVAFAVGIGTLGFDLGNLAIIAGALSVGIGFGLQSIVNNFVSGLILLFERPIKVGDWIVTSSGEGVVKRISVRSTEIETFDRSSVIVPNSELISGAVTNWTHKDRMGRLIVNVGTSYESDAAQVIRVLEEIAHQSADILRDPAPLVVFEDFGASSLDFSVRVYIRDVSDTLRVRTRLRIAIHERFRKEGIEIPFPQRDLHLRGVPEALMANGYATTQAAE